MEKKFCICKFTFLMMKSNTKFTPVHKLIMHPFYY